MPGSPLIYTPRLISASALENDPTPHDYPRGTKVIAWKNTVSQGAETLKFVLFFVFYLPTALKLLKILSTHALSVLCTPSTSVSANLPPLSRRLELSTSEQPCSFSESHSPAESWGQVAGQAKQEPSSAGASRRPRLCDPSPGNFLCCRVLGRGVKHAKEWVSRWNVHSISVWNDTAVKTSKAKAKHWQTKKWFLSNKLMVVKSDKEQVNLQFFLVSGGSGPEKVLECFWTLHTGKLSLELPLRPKVGVRRGGT